MRKPKIYDSIPSDPILISIFCDVFNLEESFLKNK